MLVINLGGNGLGLLKEKALMIQANDVLFYFTAVVQGLYNLVSHNASVDRVDYLGCSCNRQGMVKCHLGN